jgi:hypothetical protein
MKTEDIEKRLDAALAAVRGKDGGQAQNEESSRHMLPQRETRLRYDAEANRDWYSRERCVTQDRAVGGWNGGNWGGHNWSGGRQR